MDIVSRRDTLKLAASAGAMAALGAAVSVRAAAETLQEKQAKTGRADREVGPDPHANPDPDERHALVPVRDNQYRFEIGKGRSQHSALLLVTDEGIILTDPIQTNGACGCGTS